jgi:hypothetical protein
MTLQLLHSKFLIYEEKCDFLFYQSSYNPLEASRPLLDLNRGGGQASVASTSIFTHQNMYVRPYHGGLSRLP